MELERFFNITILDKARYPCVVQIGIITPLNQ